jgi:hypothetical protein
LSNANETERRTGDWTPGFVCLSLVAWVMLVGIGTHYSAAHAASRVPLCLKPETSLALRGGGSSVVCTMQAAGILR